MASTSPLAHITAHMTPSQKDTMFTKIFVGGLPYHTSDESLRTFFEQFGEIEEAVVITDRQTGKSKGYGFVTMADRAGAEKACEDPNPIIDGRKANVNLAYLGAKPRGIAGQDMGIPLMLAAGGSAYPTSGLVPMATYGIPSPYMYPSAAYLAAATATGGHPSAVAGTLPLRVSPHLPLNLNGSQLEHVASSTGTGNGSGLSPVAASTAAAAMAARLPAGYEAAAAAYPSYVSAAGYMSPTAAGYTYAGVPAQQLSQLAAYQQQQQQQALQEHLQ